MNDDPPAHTVRNNTGSENRSLSLSLIIQSETQLQLTLRRRLDAQKRARRSLSTKLFEIDLPQRQFFFFFSIPTKRMNDEVITDREPKKIGGIIQ
jgi:hypothetical protein